MYSACSGRRSAKYTDSEFVTDMIWLARWPEIFLPISSSTVAGGAAVNGKPQTSWTGMLFAADVKTTVLR